MEEVENAFNEIAETLWYMADVLEEAMNEAGEDEIDFAFCSHWKDKFRDLANVFRPPGSPPGGYPSAKVFNIESERAKRRKG